MKDLYQFDNYFPIFDSTENSFPIIIRFPSWEHSQSIRLITFGEHRDRNDFLHHYAEFNQLSKYIPSYRPGLQHIQIIGLMCKHGMTNMVSLS